MLDVETIKYDKPVFACDECGKIVSTGIVLGKAYGIHPLYFHRRCWDAFAKRVKAAIKDGGLR